MDDWRRRQPTSHGKEKLQKAKGPSGSGRERRQDYRRGRRRAGARESIESMILFPLTHSLTVGRTTESKFATPLSKAALGNHASLVISHVSISLLDCVVLLLLRPLSSRGEHRDGPWDFSPFLTGRRRRNGSRKRHRATHRIIICERIPSPLFRVQRLAESALRYHLSIS